MTFHEENPYDGYRVEVVSNVGGNVKSKKAMPMKAKKKVVAKKVVVKKQQVSSDFWTKKRDLPPMVALSIVLTLLIVAILITVGNQ